MGPLNSIIVRSEPIEIFEATINWMWHSKEYTSRFSIRLFEGKHHEFTSDLTMEIKSSIRENVLRWIAKKIVIAGENVGSKQ